jgi:hypothetical protein
VKRQKTFGSFAGTRQHKSVERLWRYALEAPVFGQPAVVAVTGTIVCATVAGHVFAISAEGEVQQDLHDDASITFTRKPRTAVENVLWVKSS